METSKKLARDAIPKLIEHIEHLEGELDKTTECLEAEQKMREQSDKAVEVMREALIDIEMNTRPERHAKLETRINVIRIDAETALKQVREILKGARRVSERKQQI